MISKDRYLQIKKSIRYMNKNKVISLCSESGLDELETNIVLSLQNGKSRVSTCIEYGMSTQMYTNTLKRAISKLSDSI